MSEDRREFDAFVGIDLGGGKGKNTAVAVIERGSGGARVCYVGTKNVAGVPFHDEQLLDFIRRFDAQRTLLAVDAPLTLTTCVRCRLPECVGLQSCEDPVIGWFREALQEGAANAKPRGGVKPAATPYTQRACELVMQREFGIWPREALGQGMGPLTARAHYLRRALESAYGLNENLIEVCPKATVHMLFDAGHARAYKREFNTWTTRAAMLEDLADKLQFEVWREGCLSNDHSFDAVLCAYTGYLWATQGWQLPERHRDIFRQDGWIWFPPLRRPPAR